MREHDRARRAHWALGGRRRFRLTEAGFVLLCLASTLVFGVWGFLLMRTGARVAPLRTVVEAFFNAAGLLQLENIGLSGESRPGGYPLPIHLARLSGILFAVSVLFAIIAKLYRDTSARWRIWLSAWPSRWFPHLCPNRRPTIICGCGWRGQALARQFVEVNNRIPRYRRLFCRSLPIIIDANPSNPFREVLEGEGVVSITGDATSPEMLRQACVHHARRLYVTAPDDETNCRIVRNVVRVREYLCPEKRKRGYASCAECTVARRAETSTDHGSCFTCVAHIMDDRLRRALSDEIRAGHPCLDLIPFDTCETTARILLTEETHALDRTLKRDAASEVVRVWVFGDTDMARAIVLKVLQIAHFRVQKRAVIRWLVPDPKATTASFYGVYPCLSPEFRSQHGIEALCTEMLPTVIINDLPVSNAQLKSSALQDFGQTANDVVAEFVYFCIDGGTVSRSCLEILREFMARNTTIPVRAYCYVNEPEIVETLDAVENESPATVPDGANRDEGHRHPPVIKLRSLNTGQVGNRYEEFFLVDAIGRADPVHIERGDIDALAKQIHYDYVVGRLRPLLKGTGASAKDLRRMEETIVEWFKGNASTTSIEALIREVQELVGRDGCPVSPWSECSEADRDSNRLAADHARTKLRAAGWSASSREIASFLKTVSDENGQPVGRETWPDESHGLMIELAEMEHRRWCAEQLLNGMLPLPSARADEWKDRKRALRAAGLHKDLRSFNSVLAEEKVKDFEQILAVLRYFAPKESEPIPTPAESSARR